MRQVHKHVPYLIGMWLKNVDRTCYECGKDMNENEGRTSPLCLNCSGRVSLDFAFRNSDYPRKVSGEK